MTLICSFQILALACDACKEVILRVPSQLPAEKFVGRGKEQLQCVIIPSAVCFVKTYCAG